MPEIMYDKYQTWGPGSDGSQSPKAEPAKPLSARGAKKGERRGASWLK